MKFLVLIMVALGFGTSAMAKSKGADEGKLVQKMVSACNEELAKDPALADTNDAETVWKNLEDKEHSNVKLSKNCHKAHETYEHKYHKEEHEEGENH